jgi:hypothetical protein
MKWMNQIKEKNDAEVEKDHIKISVSPTEVPFFFMKPALPLVRADVSRKGQLRFLGLCP